MPKYNEQVIISSSDMVVIPFTKTYPAGDCLKANITHIVDDKGGVIDLKVESAALKGA